ALLPKGAEVLPNPSGTAPGMIWQPREHLTILTFPGVPSEMKLMWHETAVPYLKRQGWGQTIIHSRSLRFWGIGESALAAKVSPFFELRNPTVAPYAGNGEVRLRVSARAASVEEAEALINPVATQLQAIAGLDYYGDDDDSLASVVGKQLQARGETLAVAESCTGGGLGQAITAIPGSSAYFWGGIISYDNQVKVNLLNVDPETLASQGAVSHAVAQQMAVGVRSRLGTTWGLSITGIAGPSGGTAAKPVGLVYIGLASADGLVESYEHRFSDIKGRDWIRHMSICTALDQLRRLIVPRCSPSLD
ncbi:MAG: CinA family nicotinamide mononucleotide deamidase-related protein, partial [Cyanobacteria bacterium]|nr:CinA family nicotinamide mononucleotide deamidase-related protein [Cyanobacteriota bacterium]MDW8203055.1 CinA family nicotinamide mononucleotide deamidase-related protein [Cyanobacteriota bacterium SKYGB_h_bin112]